MSVQKRAAFLYRELASREQKLIGILCHAYIKQACFIAQPMTTLFCVGLLLKKKSRTVQNAQLKRFPGNVSFIPILLST